jgi:hypothetical protein
MRFFPLFHYMKLLSLVGHDGAKVRSSELIDKGGLGIFSIILD